MITAQVRMWGRIIGAITLKDGDPYASFEYVPDFTKSGIQVAPFKMKLPRGRKVFRFPELSTTFKGLPGMIADSLPDKYGNALIDNWLARQGRDSASFSIIERLCYLGSKGMGALEYIPENGPSNTGGSQPVDIASLVQLASDILHQRKGIKINGNLKNKNAMEQMLLVGTSAGGARAKAVIAVNEKTKDICSGQVTLENGFSHWLIKFDGVANNSDRELADPQGYGSIEYAYYLMAKKAGIAMEECRLYEENGRRHFMTRRFDRTPDGRKLHMQSLAALCHLDFHQPGAHSYEQAFQAIQMLELPQMDSEELYRRMVFNIVARNQDDHVKNISFLMTKDGTWSLSPAYDVMYSYNPTGKHTSLHQMSMNGKRDNFVRSDFKQIAKVAKLKQGRANILIEEVINAVAEWEKFAKKSKVPSDKIRSIQKNHRLQIA